MVQYLSKRPLTAAAPETMGLFTSYYDVLQKALSDNLPEEVESFNRNLSKQNQITQKDWYALMKIFLDYTVRSNESVYLNMGDKDSIDIFKCVRFATEKASRRPARKPVIKDQGANRSRIIRLLAKILLQP